MPGGTQAGQQYYYESTPGVATPIAGGGVAPGTNRQNAPYFQQVP